MKVILLVPFIIGTVSARCQIPGKWSDWTAIDCTKEDICSKLEKKRTRTCSNPSGLGCDGKAVEEETIDCASQGVCEESKEYVLPEDDSLVPVSVADKICQQNGYRLPEVRSAEDQAAIEELIKASGLDYEQMSFPLGIERINNEWKWKSGASLEYTNWSPSLYDSPNRNCAVIDGSSAFQWWTATCEYNHVSVLCEKTS